MAEIYNVGRDELNEWSWHAFRVYSEDGTFKDKLDEYEWFVYKYEDGGYDGSGEAVALLKEGEKLHGSLEDNRKLHIFDLGHCSCYGPLEGGPKQTMTPKEFLALQTNIHYYDAGTEVKDKVRSLLGM